MLSSTAGFPVDSSIVSRSLGSSVLRKSSVALPQFERRGREEGEATETP